MIELKDLPKYWLDAKAEEQAAKDKRLAIEAEMESKLGIPETWEGSHTMEEQGLKINVKRTMSHKVDGDKIKTLATQANLTGCLDTLFRWKADINKKNWKDADENITKIFESAITTTPGKITFSIKEEDTD